MQALKSRGHLTFHLLSARDRAPATYILPRSSPSFFFFCHFPKLSLYNPSSLESTCWALFIAIGGSRGSWLFDNSFAPSGWLLSPPFPLVFRDRKGGQLSPQWRFAKGSVRDVAFRQTRPDKNSFFSILVFCIIATHKR